jgi:hypothetical protein
MAHHVFKPWPYQTSRTLVRLLCLIVLSLARQACAQTTRPEFPNPGNAHMSRESQRELGLQAAAQVYKTIPVLSDNSPETKYIPATRREVGRYHSTGTRLAV